MIAQMKENLINQLKQSVKYCTAVSPNTKSTPKAPKVSKLTVPKLTKDHLEDIKYVTGLHMGTSGISWALLNVEDEKQHCLLEWNNFPFPQNTQKLHIYEMCKVIFDVQKRLPQSDIYVIESLSPPIRSHSNPLQQGVLELISQLQSMLCVALSKGSNMDDPKLVFLKNRLTARVFNLLLKSECINSRHIIENIIASQILTDEEYYVGNRSSTNSHELKRSLTKTDEGAAKYHEEQTRTSTERNEERESNFDNRKRALAEIHEVDSALNFHTRLVMSEELVSVYDTSKGYTAESLAIALLHAISFTDLIVRPRASVLNRLVVTSGS